MTITYRDATPADAAALARIGADTFTITFGHLYSDADLSGFLEENHSAPAAAACLARPGYATRLAHAGDGIAGYAMLAPAALPHLDPARTTLELKRLYLMPAHFGAGIADVFMEWTHAVATERGAHSLALSVFSENLRAMRFYQRHGFAVVGEYRFRVGSQLDREFVYVKHLR